MKIYDKTRNRKQNKSMTMNHGSKAATHLQSMESLKLPDILRTRKTSREDSVESRDSKLGILKAKRAFKMNTSNQASQKSIGMVVIDQQDLGDKLQHIRLSSGSPDKTQGKLEGMGDSLALHTYDHSPSNH